jgi:hypothetical protein
MSTNAPCLCCEAQGYRSPCECAEQYRFLTTAQDGSTIECCPPLGNVNAYLVYKVGGISFTRPAQGTPGTFCAGCDWQYVGTISGPGDSVVGICSGGLSYSSVELAAVDTNGITYSYRAVAGDILSGANVAASSSLTLTYADCTGRRFDGLLGGSCGWAPPVWPLPSGA